MADKDLEILIKTKAELDGAKAAQQSLNKLGAETEDAGKKTKLFDGHMGELKKTARELSREFPLAGLALRAAITPIGAVLTASVAVFAKAKEMLAQWNKELDDTAAKLADPTFKAGIDARRDALQEAAVAAAAFADKMAHLNDIDAEVQRSIVRHTALMHELAAAEKETADARFGVDSSRLENQFKAGLISAETYYRRLAELEIKHRNDQLAREKQSDAQDIASVGEALAFVKLDQSEASGAVKPAQKARVAAEAKLAKDKADQPGLEAEAARLAEVAKQKLAAADDARDIFYDQKYLAQPAIDQSDAAEKDAQNAKRLVEQNKRSINEQEENLPGVQGAASRAEKRIEEAEDKVRDLTAQLEQLKKSAGIKEAGDAKTAAEKNFEDLIKTPQGAMIDQIALIQQAKDLGQRVSAAQEQYYREHIGQLTAQNQSFQRLHQLLSVIAGSMSSFDRKVAALESQLNNKANHNF